MPKMVDRPITFRAIVNLRCNECNHVWTAPSISESVRCPKCHGKFTTPIMGTERVENAPRV